MVQLAYAFGPFRFDAAQMLLQRDGTPVPLGGRAGTILHMLLSAQGDVVGKDALIEAAWPGMAIEESNLSVQISKLRQAIGAEWIRTVERVGYRFAPAQLTGGTHARVAPPRVVLLPLGQYGGGTAAGLLEEINIALARYRSFSLVVAPKAVSSDAWRRHARRHNADYLIDGSARQHEDGTRVTLRLIEAAAGRQLWADAFDLGRGLSEQSLAGRIASTIEAQIHAAEIDRSRRERPQSMEAYDLYLRGRARIYTSRQDDNAVGYALYQQALELEPESMLYLSAAAEAVHHRSAAGWRGISKDDQQLCYEFATRALQSGSRDAVSLALIGNALFTSFEVEWATELTTQAAKLNPNAVLTLTCDGISHMFAGSLNTARTQLEASLALDPDDPNQRFTLAALARVECIDGNLERAYALARRGTAMSPGHTHSYWQLIDSALRLGRRSEAERAIARYRRIAPDVTIASIEAGQRFSDPSRVDMTLEALRQLGIPER